MRRSCFRTVSWFPSKQCRNRTSTRVLKNFFYSFVSIVMGYYQPCLSDKWYDTQTTTGVTNYVLSPVIDKKWWIISYKLNEPTNKLLISHRTPGWNEKRMARWSSGEKKVLVPVLLAGWCPCVRSLNILPGPVWVFSTCFSFLSQSKHMQFRFIGHLRIACRLGRTHGRFLRTGSGSTLPLTQCQLGKAPPLRTNEDTDSLCGCFSLVLAKQAT